MMWQARGWGAPTRVLDFPLAAEPAQPGSVAASPGVKTVSSSREPIAARECGHERSATVVKWVIITVIAIAVLALILYNVLPVVSAVRAIFQQESEPTARPGEVEGKGERD